MKSRSLHALLVAALSVAVVSSGFAQTRQTELDTPAGKFPLYVTAEYLGMAGLKTVVRLRLRAPELSMAAGKRGLTSFSGELMGSFLKGEDVVQAFKYPVSGEIGTRTTFQYAFLRSIEPGTYKLRLNLVAPGGRDVGEAVIELLVPEVGTQFSPDMAPTEASTLPAAEAIVIADEAERAAAGPGGGSKLKILPPDRETPVGLLRLEADASPPITKVEFYLEDKLIVRRTKPPYSVEIDLGSVPRKQTVRAVGYDSNGKLIDEDAWAINQGSARLAVKILPQPDPAGGNVKVKVAVQSIGGGVAKQVELFLGDKKLKTWTGDGPYEVTIPLAQYGKSRVPPGDGHRRGRQGSQRHPVPQGAEHDHRERARGRRAAPHLRPRQGQPLRQGPRRAGLRGPGGRARPEGDRLRSRREAAADDRPRGGRIRARWRSPCPSCTTPPPSSSAA